MKFSKSQIFILSFFTLFFLSCKREIPQVAGLETQLNKFATLQIFNATVKAVRNYVYVDGVQVSGAALALGGIFPASAYGIKVSPGTRSVLVKDTLLSTTQIPITFSQNFEAFKSYTTFTYDTTTNIKQVTVLNNIVIPTDTSARLRFANFVYNTSALPNVDIYSFRKISGTPIFLNGSPVFTSITPVFSNIASNTITNFIPYPSGLTDTFYVYATGTTSPLIVKQLVTSLVPSRSYTSVYNGSFKGVKAVSTFATY